MLRVYPLDSRTPWALGGEGLRELLGALMETDYSTDGTT